MSGHLYGLQVLIAGLIARVSEVRKDASFPASVREDVTRRITSSVASFDRTRALMAVHETIKLAEVSLAPYQPIPFIRHFLPGSMMLRLEVLRDEAQEEGMKTLANLLDVAIMEAKRISEQEQEQEHD